MEYLDLVDENDKIIGVESRHNIDKNNLNNYRVINIIIENSSGKIILAKRSKKKKYFGGCFFFSTGGHVKSKESYEKAAYRELEEELGISNVELKEIGYFKPHVLETSSFSKLYKLIYDGEFKINADEIEKMCYFEKDELNKLVKSNPEKFSTDFVKIYNWIMETKK